MKKRRSRFHFRPLHLLVALAVFLGLSLYYKEIGDKQNSRKYAQYVLEKINPGDSDAQAILDQISK